MILVSQPPLAVLDACVLVGALKRNLLLSLAEADLFLVRWSPRILDEAESAIARVIAERGGDDAVRRASRVRRAMERAFEDASVAGYESLAGVMDQLPDHDDEHVIATAVKARAPLIVTDNIRHFPTAILASLDLEAKTADAFIADAIDFDPATAIAAVRRMRNRFRQPAWDFAMLLRAMHAVGLKQTAMTLSERAEPF